MKKLISLAAALLYSSVSPVLAQNDPGYYHGDFFSNGQAGDNPNWMAVIPGERRLSELSIPGTHNTMAKYGGDAVECQSMTLAQQLNSGVRALDIRCRHEGPSFRIFHGAVSQFADFAKDVLFVCNTFLAAHPTETILMRVKQEGKGDGVFGAAPIGTFDEAFEAYRKGMGSSFWINTGSNNPTLDEVRGKIVIIRAGFASTAGISYPWNDSPEGQLDSPKGSTLLQDRYKMSTNWDLYDKWENVKAHLNKAVNGRTNDLYVNFLSASGGSFPYFVASGHSSHETGSLRLATGLTTPGWSSTYPDFPRIACVPLIDIICLGFCDAPDVCTIVFEGINILTTDYINHGNARGRVGVIFADYPGWGLIEAVISLNGIRQVTNIEDSGQGSLRWAIETSLPSDPSAVDFSGGVVVFAPELSGKTILLKSQIVIDRDIKIDGVGLEGGITISGGGASRVFYIASENARVKLSQLTITGGHVDGGKGGAILSQGKSLEVKACTFNDNFAWTGSAIHADGGPPFYDIPLFGRLPGRAPGDVRCVLDNCTIVNNTAKMNASVSIFRSEMTLNHCTVVNNRNTSSFAGAGLANDAGQLKISNSIISGNTSTNGPADIDGNFTAPDPNIVGRHEFGTVTGVPPIATAPLLGQLSDNGGPTRTLKPTQFPGAGVWNGQLGTDQRGERRPAQAGTAPNLGAVEISPGPDIRIFSSGGLYKLAPGDILDFGHYVPRTFTAPSPAPVKIKNQGNQVLSGLTISIDGPDAAMFWIETLPASTIDPQGEANFTVRFATASPGVRRAYLLIKSNDPDEGHFHLILSGIGDHTFLSDGTSGGTIIRPRNPAWNRPDGEKPPSALSPTATATPYDVVSFTVGTPGYFTLTSTTRGSSWNNTLFLYERAFDAFTPLTNVLVGGTQKDAFSLISCAYRLASGIRYYAVTTGTLNSDSGDYTLKITGPGEIKGFTPAAGLTPRQSGTEVSTYPSFSWISVPGTTYEVFLGTNPSNLVSLGFQTSGFPVNPPLSHNKTYYWRLDSHQAGAVVSSGVLTFTTRASIEVTTVLDENDGRLGLGVGDSLREAIVAAAAGESSIIAFAPQLSGQTIRLGAGAIRISSDVTIDGSPLPSIVKISGNNASRVFEIAAGRTVKMEAITITEGTVAMGDNGAGILNAGNLSLKDTTLSGNTAHAGNGGGIHNQGILILDRCTLSANNAMAGGGMYNEGASASIRATNVTFSGNSSASGGGAIVNTGAASLTLIHNTISDNFVSSGRGGGIEINSGTLVVENSIIAGNEARNGMSSINKMGGTITAGGVNIIGENSSIETEFPAGPFVGRLPNPLYPKLSPLDYFGGRTRTQPPAAGSLAFDAARGSSPPRDQRGGSRPRGPASDIGSVESDLSSNADLSTLAISAGRLSPLFFADIVDYRITVASSVESVRVRANAYAFQSTVAVGINGVFSPLPSELASSPFPLEAGENKIELKVTAENGTIKIYTITARRGARPETNTDLKSLVLSSGSLNPSFTPGVISYGATVGNAATSITVTSSATEPSASMELSINFEPFHPISSGEASSPLSLKVGSNLIEIRVTSLDGSLTTKHTLTVIREAPALSNANLSALAIGKGSLAPAFSREVFFYEVQVSGEIADLSLTPTAVRPSAKVAVRINGGSIIPISSGGASPSLPLHGGENVLKVTVTAEDGTTVNTYTIAVTRVMRQNELASKTDSNFSRGASISADCRFVAFSSSAVNLLPNDQDHNNSEDVFVYDRLTDTIERVSVNNAGDEGTYNGSGGKAHSSSPSISTDGRYVAFQSRADNLVPNDSNGRNDESRGQDIFVYDRTTKTIERVSVQDNGDEANQQSENPSISADGRYVAFVSRANNLVPGFETDEANIYLHDRTTHKTVGIDVPFGDFHPNLESLNPAISADGNFVAFELWADRNADNQDLSYQYTDIYVYHRSNQKVERITGDYEGRAAIPDRFKAPYGNRSTAPSISADGRYVAFQSDGNGIDFDDYNSGLDVFIHDRTRRLDRRVSVDLAGSDVLFPRAINPSISGDGHFVAFESTGRLFQSDLITGEITLLADTGGKPSSSFDGRCVAFEDGKIRVSVTGDLAASSQAGLASLNWNVDATGAGFTPGLNSYTATTGNRVETANLRPVAADDDATILIRVNSGNFEALNSEVAALPLAVGRNSIDVQVTAKDGKTVSVYSLEVFRSASTNATLARLELLAGLPAGASGALSVLPLMPSFSSLITSYSVGVPNGSTSLTVMPAVAETNASVKVNGAPLSPGVVSQPINLNLGSNTITIAVTAPDGITSSAYVVTAFRALSGDATLSSLVPGTGALSPGFSSLATSYSIAVPGGTAAITVTPTAAEPGAMISVNGRPSTSGAPSSALDLYEGTTAISILVTSPDGSASRVYSLNVRHDPPASAIEDVTRPGDNIISSHPASNSPITEPVANAIDNDKNTKYLNFASTAGSTPFTAITGFTVTPGVGVSVVTGVALTSANDSTERDPRSYKLEGSNDGSLFTVIAQGSVPVFSGRFARQAISFANAAPYTSYRLTFPTVADATLANSMQIAEVELLGTISTGLPPLSNNADLANLVPSAGTLTPGFGSAVTAYTVSVPNAIGSMTFLPTTAQANATVRVNGANTTSGTVSSAINLAVGNNAVTIAVTAPDGTTVKNYAVTVTRAGVGPTTKGYAQLVRDHGAVSYWRLGESTGEIARDEIGAKHGLLLNGVTLGVAGALAIDSNTAARFRRETQQKIDVAWSATLNPPEFSAEIWARVTGSIADHRSPLTSRADGPQRGFIFYAEPGNTWQFWTGKGDFSGWDVIPGPAVEPEKWTHLVATYDGATKRFFVNGLEVGSSTAAFGPNDENPLRFGGGGTEGDGNYFFEGDVDEPAIYNKALTREQILQHFLTGVEGTAATAELSIRNDRGQIVIRYTGTLQSARQVTGPYSVVAGASSPFTVTPDATARFYIAR